jgi:hypothetical protein
MLLIVFVVAEAVSVILVRGRRAKNPVLMD